MSASNTDKFKKLTNNFSTTLSAPIVGASDTSMSLSSTTNLPTDTGIVLVIDRVNSSGTATPTSREYVKGTVSGSNIINLVRGVGNSTAQAHSTGAVVEQVVDQTTINDLMDGLLLEHNQDGTHGAITSTNATLTTPKLITSAKDTNGNEIFKVSATTSAVNEVTITNAATGNAPQVSASGDDTNIGLNLASKGTGAVQINSLKPWVYLGSAQITANSAAVANNVAVGLGVTVTVPTWATKTRITVDGQAVSGTSSGFAYGLAIWDGTVGSGTLLEWSQITVPSAGAQIPAHVSSTFTSSTGSKTYNVGMVSGSSTGTLIATSTSPATIVVECC